ARDVNAADHATAARSDESEIPRAASHVEHARAWLNGLPRHKFLGDIFDGAGDLTEVARFPGRLLSGFNRFEVWDGWGFELGVHVVSRVLTIKASRERCRTSLVKFLWRKSGRRVTEPREAELVRTSA